jgi:hypothetical protein
MVRWSTSFRVRNPGIVTIQKMFRPRTANSRPPWDKWQFCREMTARSKVQKIFQMVTISGPSTLNPLQYTTKVNFKKI